MHLAGALAGIENVWIDIIDVGCAEDELRGGAVVKDQGFMLILIHDLFRTLPVPPTAIWSQ